MSSISSRPLLHLAILAAWFFSFSTTGVIKNIEDVQKNLQEQETSITSSWNFNVSKLDDRLLFKDTEKFRTTSFDNSTSGDKVSNESRRSRTSKTSISEKPNTKKSKKLKNTNLVESKSKGEGKVFKSDDKPHNRNFMVKTNARKEAEERNSSPKKKTPTKSKEISKKRKISIREKRDEGNPIKNDNEKISMNSVKERSGKIKSSKNSESSKAKEISEKFEADSKPQKRAQQKSKLVYEDEL